MKLNILKGLFGGGRNVVAETVGVFRANTEAGAQRAANYDQAALAQYAGEFQHARKGLFDRFMDGLNRLPRPLMVIAVFTLFAMAMIDPLWFAERMQGLALVPQPLWWFAGVVVSFYFGGRYQVKSQEFHKSIAEATQRLPVVLENIKQIRELRHDSPGVANTGTDTALADAVLDEFENPALEDWKNPQPPKPRR
ncbi:Holin of 3TMs, for gene-transfer release [Aliiroseovarius crassostreae]|uniref:Carboxylesterase n=1 Tax=Aliiroseovarius crassostreae TaxID=154981 RepID=A0A0P7KPI7_9RHOB|nr:holin family protein [Aliiroseovarius crassostreae]KPN64273.1 carboxylesterase [Aliiroseovarius crassostreae]SFU31452.1 Holin of 3TMs, for gene-transfer release [Aliiroseovarius crassostreae]